jgi:hypothetical protein
MAYIRKIASGHSIAGIIDIPEKWKSKNVEILVFPVAETKSTAAKKSHGPKCLHGALKAYANPHKIASESTAWQEAVEAKHGHR